MRDVLQWDVESWRVALAFWDEQLGPRTGLDCLEIGGREGGLSLWLALRQHRVTCSDRSGAARAAAPLHSRYSVASLVTYQDIDATAIPFKDRFDVIVFKSVLGTIGGWGRPRERQALAIGEMHKALRPGGLLMFAENATGSLLHVHLRRRFLEWGRQWRYIAPDEMKELLCGFSRVEVRTTGFLAAFGVTEGQRNALARLDRAILNRALPNRFHYIVYGVAEK